MYINNTNIVTSAKVGIDTHGLYANSRNSKINHDNSIGTQMIEYINYVSLCFAGDTKTQHI